MLEVRLIVGLALIAAGCGRLGYDDGIPQGPVPLVQYHLDEAASGQGPMELTDAAPDPLNIPLSYVGESPSFETGAGVGGRHLRFFGVTGDDTGGAIVDIAGTKVEQLHGSRTATLELVFELDACDDGRSNHQRVFGVGDGNHYVSSGWLTARTDNGGAELAISLAGRPAWTASLLSSRGDQCPVRTRTVVHLLVDTEEVATDDRMRAYLNGARISLVPNPNSDDPPNLGDTIDLGSGRRRLYLGRAHNESATPIPDEIRTSRSRIYYAAAYLEALDDATIVERARRLLANDDR